MTEVAKSIKSEHRYKIGRFAFVEIHRGSRLLRVLRDQLLCVVLNVMRMVTIPVENIADWPSFHDTFQRELGFPDFYGRNMDAWIDCMSSVDAPSDGASRVTVEPGEVLALRIDGPFEFRRRCPEQYNALIECTAACNIRRVEIGERPVLALVLVGRA